MLPINLTKYFWDAPLGTIDRSSNKIYIMSRLLELGDEIAVKWLEETYSADELRQTVKTSRSLSPRSLNYWKLKYNLV